MVFCFGFAAGAEAEPLFNPNEIGSIDTPGDAFAVAVVEARAHVADGDAGLRVIGFGVPEPGALLLQLAAASMPLGLWARHRRVT